MNKFTFKACCAVLFGTMLLLPAHPGRAQSVVQSGTASATVSTTATGTITQIAGGQMFIKSDGVANPVGYILRKNTTYVDDQEAPVEVTNIKTGRAVIIYYVVDEGAKVATKIVLRNAPAP